MKKEDIKLGDAYEIIQEIGSGGSGTVYLSYHKRLQKNVVIKKLRDGVKLDYRMETDILKNLHHEYLPQVFDFIQNETGIYTVMDFIPGHSFAELINSGTKFTPNQVLKYACQLCAAVEYLHTRKVPVIHGDIKPANIMLTPDDNICLIDFNISGFKDNLNLAGFTRGYAAPEQCRAIEEARKKQHEANISVAEQINNNWVGAAARNSEEDVTEIDEAVNSDTEIGEIITSDTEIDGAVVRNTETDAAETRENMVDKVSADDIKDGIPSFIDQRADIFAVGATLYHLLTGNKPEADFSRIIPVSKLNIQVSEGLAYVIDKAMQPFPQKRFQSMAEMKKALSSVAKKDKRFRRRLFIQDSISVLCIIAAAVCAVISVMGYGRIKTEKTDFLYENAQDYYERQEYEEGYDYIMNQALADTQQYSTSELANLYYLAAECCFEIEQYTEAVRMYKVSLEYDPYNSDIYCNYAIALANIGDLDSAAVVLQQAVDAGVGEENIYLVSGEIALANQEYDTAQEYFEQVIKTAGDSYLVSRVYNKYSECFERQDGYADSRELLQGNIEVLKRAEQAVGSSYLSMIYERLVEAYSCLASLTGDKSCYQSAIEYLNRIIELGWGTYNVYMNLALMYGAVEQYEESFGIYNEAMQLYGENYEPYKNMALLEAQRQSGLENKDRDYNVFYEYYCKASELFEKTGIAWDKDMDMQRLKQVYTSLKELGWLE